MGTYSVEGEQFFHFDKAYFNEQVKRLCPPALEQFRHILRNHALFHGLFLFLGVAEIISFFIFFTFLADSAFLAASLAIIFLSVFSYFILRLYFHTKKPEQIAELRDQYLNACRNLLNYQEGIPEHHMALTNAANRMVSCLEGMEYNFYRPPRIFAALVPTMEKFSCWCHWGDVHQLKELLLLASIEEHIKLVKIEPTNLEVHAALANAYVMISGLYGTPARNEEHDEDRWTPPDSILEALEKKHRAAAERAIEEFKILNDYAPDDPWVHAQLAYSYHDLQMPEEEIKEYEAILKLRPGDRQTLYRLGILYFQQGFTAQGLRIYEELKQANYKKAESLISYYDAFSITPEG